MSTKRHTDISIRTRQLLNRGRVAKMNKYVIKHCFKNQQRIPFE